MSRHSVLTHSTLHPRLSHLVTRLVDGHTCLKVVHTAQNKVHRTTTTQVALTGRRQEREERESERRGWGEEREGEDE